MRLIPLLLNFEDSPMNLTVGHQVSAGRLAWDAKLLYDRETKRSVQFNATEDGDPIMHASLVEVPQKLPKDAQGDFLWERQGHVNQTDDDWYNISQWLHDNTEYSWENDVIIAWINGNPGDHTGIGGPLQAAAWNDDRRPDVGGVALNGIGQVTSAASSSLRGSWHRRMVLYAAHEMGHALGERHSGFDENGVDSPRDPGHYMNVMGYGYNFLAAGIPDSRTGNYFEEGGLFTVRQRERLYSHDLFADRPDTADAMNAGKWDAKEVRIDSMDKFFNDINAGIATDELLARMNIGALQSER